MAIDAALEELTQVLDGFNYSVFLRRYCTPISSSVIVQHSMTDAIGPAAIVGGSSVVAAPEMLAEIERCLRFPGDAGAGPPPGVIESDRFADLLAVCLVHVKERAADAHSITEFWLKEGHPGYPVWWGFAYMIAGLSGTEILIGSSSD